MRTSLTHAFKAAALGLAMTAAPAFAQQDLEAQMKPVERASDSQVGYNVGAEATYRFTPMVGVALLLRFTRASPEFDFGGEPTTVNVGDVQFGGGLRLRF